jgi:hypothetical protein
MPTKQCCQGFADLVFICVCGVAGAFSMGTGAFGAGLFGMNMEAEGLFGPGSEGLFLPITSTLSGMHTG